MSAAVTGAAWRTPLGSTIDEVMERLLAGERAARANPRFPAESYRCPLAAVGPDPKPSRHRKFLRRMGLLGVEAGVEALARAGHAGPNDRLGIFYGYGGLRAYWDEVMPSLERQRDDADGAWARGLKLLHPFWMLHHLSNNAHALLGIDLGARGDGATYGGANAGAQALCGALAALADDAVDVALVIAADSLVEPETLIELGARGVAARGPLETLASPYDEAAAGFVPGEAAAALVLERSGGFRIDAACGAGPAGMLAGRLGAAELVDGAALASPAEDRAEREALARVLGVDTPLTAVQAATGQLGGAAALVQAIALMEMLRRGVVPPVAGLRDPAPGPLALARRAAATAARSALGVAAGSPDLTSAVYVLEGPR